jgi:hypothetical protein
MRTHPRARFCTLHLDNMGTLSDALRAQLDRMAELDRRTADLLADMSARTRATLAELDAPSYSDADHLADARELLEAHGWTVTPPAG